MLGQATVSSYGQIWLAGFDLIELQTMRFVDIGPVRLKLSVLRVQYRKGSQKCEPFR